MRSHVVAPAALRKLGAGGSLEKVLPLEAVLGRRSFCIIRSSGHSDEKENVTRHDKPAVLFTAHRAVILYWKAASGLGGLNTKFE